MASPWLEMHGATSAPPLASSVRPHPPAPADLDAAVANVKEWMDAETGGGGGGDSKDGGEAKGGK